MRVRLCVNRTVSDASMQVRYIRFQYMYPENTPGKTPVSPVKHPSVPREHPLAEHPSGHTMRENTHKAPLGGVVRGALGVFCLLCVGKKWWAAHTHFVGVLENLRTRGTTRNTGQSHDVCQRTTASHTRTA